MTAMPGTIADPGPPRDLAPRDAGSHNPARPDRAAASIALVSVLFLLFAALFLATMPLNGHLAEGRDFAVYWATGRQLVHHANPYDPAAMGQMERAGNPVSGASRYMRNPPWSLPLAWPLGLLSARAASLPWSLLMAAFLVIAVRLLWGMFGRPGSHLDLLGYAFMPAVTCVLMGQTSLFLLLGLVLFLRLYRTHPFWAGAALWLCMLKPHLFLVFGAVLLTWIFVSRRYRILLGAIVAMAASCALTECIDPHAWMQYLQWAHRSGIAREFIPCFGVALRNLINPAKEWIVFTPALVACVWGLLYFWRRRQNWDWLEHGNVVMLVSLLAAPYCWIYDQCLVLPALLYAACSTRSRNLLTLLAMVCLALDLQLIFAVPLHSAAYLWPAPVWLLWYWLARRSARTETVSAAQEAMPAIVA